MKKKVKFCPRCGTPLNLIDAYCIKCGYSFIKKSKKLNLGQILAILFFLAMAWIGIRLLLNRPIIPQEIGNFTKSFVYMLTNKTG